MKDQVDALKKKGIAAECIDSTKTREELQEINASLREGKLRLLYCAPERLNNEGFVEMMKRVKGGVRLIGVDEAHCISEVCLPVPAILIIIANRSPVGTFFPPRLFERLESRLPLGHLGTDTVQLLDSSRRSMPSESSV